MLSERDRHGGVAIFKSFSTLLSTFEYYPLFNENFIQNFSFGLTNRNDFHIILFWEILSRIIHRNNFHFFRNFTFFRSRNIFSVIIEYLELLICWENIKNVQSDWESWHQNQITLSAMLSTASSSFSFKQPPFLTILFCIKFQFDSHSEQHFFKDIKKS